MATETNYFIFLIVVVSQFIAEDAVRIPTCLDRCCIGDKYDHNTCTKINLNEGWKYIYEGDKLFHLPNFYPLFLPKWEFVNKKQCSFNWTAISIQGFRDMTTTNVNINFPALSSAFKVRFPEFKILGIYQIRCQLTTRNIIDVGSGSVTFNNLSIDINFNSVPNSCGYAPIHNITSKHSIGSTDYQLGKNCLNQAGTLELNEKCSSGIGDMLSHLFVWPLQAMKDVLPVNAIFNLNCCKKCPILGINDCCSSVCRQDFSLCRRFDGYCKNGVFISFNNVKEETCGRL